MLASAAAAEGAAQAVAHTEVSLGVTLLFAALLAAMIACLALEEKLPAKKSVIVGLFAVVLTYWSTAATAVPLGWPGSACGALTGPSTAHSTASSTAKLCTALPESCAQPEVRTRTESLPGASRSAPRRRFRMEVAETIDLSG